MWPISSCYWLEVVLKNILDLKLPVELLYQNIFLEKHELLGMIFSGPKFQELLGYICSSCTVFCGTLYQLIP